MNPIFEIIKALTSGWLWTVVFAFTGAFAWFLHDALGKQRNRDQLDRLLDGRHYAILYHELLQAALGRIDWWLTPSIGPSLETREAEGRRPWSWPLFDLSLRLALVYPLLSLLISWGVRGTDGKLGSLVVLPAAGWGVRVVALAGLALIFWLSFRSRRAQTRARRFGSEALRLLALVGSAAGTFRGVFAFIFAFIAIVALAGAVTVAGAVFVTFAGALAVTVAVIVALAGAGFAAGAGAGVGAVASAFAFAGAVAIAGAVAAAAASAFAGPAAIVLAVAVAVGIAVVVRATAARNRFSFVPYAALIAFLLVALAIAVRISPGIDANSATLILFLGVLPLLNAVFDFLSIGLTRFLLRRGAYSAGLGALGWALCDLVSALVFFALLGLALVTIVHWLNILGAAPLLDLAMLFTDVRTDPSAYWWLYITLFSTLMPTLLHFVLASFSALLAMMPEILAQFIRRELSRIAPDDDALPKKLAFWALSTIGFLAIAAVAFGPYGLVRGVLALFPYAGNVYLYWFESYAAWLGAPVVPG